MCFLTSLFLVWGEPLHGGGGEGVPSNQLDQLFQQIQFDNSPDMIMMKIIMVVMVVKMMLVIMEMCNIHDNGPGVY